MKPNRGTHDEIDGVRSDEGQGQGDAHSIDDAAVSQAVRNDVAAGSHARLVRKPVGAMWAGGVMGG